MDFNCKLYRKDVTFAVAYRISIKDFTKISYRYHPRSKKTNDRMAVADMYT